MKISRWLLVLGILGVSWATLGLATSSDAQVQAVHLRSKTNKQIELKWHSVTGATKYQIRVTHKVHGLYELVKKVQTTKRWGTVKGLKANHRYYFRVRAYLADGYGTYSKRLVVMSAVDQVSAVTLSDTTSNSVTLTWPTVSGADKYQVRVMTKSGDTFYLFTKKQTTESTMTIDGLTSDQTYYFKVRAQHNDTYGPYSETIDATTDVALPFWNAGEDLPGIARGAVSGTLSTENSTGRTGSYYLPAGYNTEAKPLLVLYHGTNGDGAEILNWFSTYAADSDFIIVAPDSRQSPSGDYIWEVGTTAGEVTEDVTHTLNCITEVDSIAGVAFDPNRVMTAGFSAGGSSAPYMASNDNRFTHYAILHGGVFTGGLGENVIPGWLSTGSEDTLRTPEMYNTYYNELFNSGFTDLTYTLYDEGHEINSSERSDLISWWLD